MADGHLFNNISLGGRGGTVSSLSCFLLFDWLIFHCFIPQVLVTRSKFLFHLWVLYTVSWKPSLVLMVSVCLLRPGILVWGNTFQLFHRIDASFWWHLSTTLWFFVKPTEISGFSVGKDYRVLTAGTFRIHFNILIGLRFSSLRHFLFVGASWRICTSLLWTYMSLKIQFLENGCVSWNYINHLFSLSFTFFPLCYNGNLIRLLSAYCWIVPETCLFLFDTKS